MSPQCRIYASLKKINIFTDNGLHPIQHQAIIYTNAGLFIAKWTLRNKYKNFIHENASENIVCEMAAI